MNMRMGTRVIVTLPNDPELTEGLRFSDGMTGTVVGFGRTLEGVDGRRTGLEVHVLFDGWGEALRCQASDLRVTGHATLTARDYYLFSLLDSDVMLRTARETSEWWNARWAEYRLEEARTA